MTSETAGAATERTAIITGGSRGMGRNTAVNLAKRGVDVIFTYHSKQAEADSLTREIEAMGGKAAASRLDTGNLGAFDGFVAHVRKTLESWDRARFDYLVNNAGNSQHIDFDKMTEADFDAVVNVHFKGVYFLTQKLLPLINDGGRIVNISSGLTRVAVPGSSAYAAAKGAVEVFTRYLAKELGPRRIAANVVAPGPVQTDFSGGMVRDNPEVNRTISNMTALGRPGVPDDVGPMIAALLLQEQQGETSMYLVMGITGKVGGAIARHLLKQGKQVRALVRNRGKAAKWADQRVELVDGDWNDATAIAAALKGVEGAFVMLPTVWAPSPDGFFENFLFGLQAAQGGTLPVFYNPTNRKSTMVATNDIGAEVAKLLTGPAWSEHRVIELGSMVSADEVAEQLDEVLKRDVKAFAVPRAGWAEAFEQFGVPKGHTGPAEEMFESVNAGWMELGITGTEHVAGTTSARDVFAAPQQAV